MPTRNVMVLAISTLSASLASASITVLFSPVMLLSILRKFSSGAMLRTTEPTIKLTTGKGPVQRKHTLYGDKTYLLIFSNIINNQNTYLRARVNVTASMGLIHGCQLYFKSHEGLIL